MSRDQGPTPTAGAERIVRHHPHKQLPQALVLQGTVRLKSSALGRIRSLISPAIAHMFMTTAKSQQFPDSRVGIQCLLAKECYTAPGASQAGGFVLQSMELNQILLWPRLARTSCSSGHVGACSSPVGPMHFLLGITHQAQASRGTQELDHFKA